MVKTNSILPLFPLFLVLVFLVLADSALSQPQTTILGGLSKIWTFLHDIATYKDRAYLVYRDQGVNIMDISDIRKPR